MDFMKKERMAEVKKGGDIRAAYTHALTDLGRERARSTSSSPGTRRGPRHARSVYGGGEETDGPGRWRLIASRWTAPSRESS